MTALTKKELDWLIVELTFSLEDHPYPDIAHSILDKLILMEDIPSPKPVSNKMFTVLKFPIKGEK